MRRKAVISSQQGLGPLASDAIRHHVEESHDLTIVRRLRSDLAYIEEEWGKAQRHNRNDALAVLRVLQFAISDLSDEHDARNPDIVITSQTTALLGRLIGQLEDLRHGLVGELVQPDKGVAGAMLKFDETEMRDIALTLVRCFKERGDTLIVACKKVSVTFGEMRLKHRSKNIDQVMIKSWWKNRPK